MAACSLGRADLVFILDASSSATNAKFQKMKWFVRHFLQKADIENGDFRVGLNIYSTDANIIFHLDAYNTRADVTSAVDGILHMYGSTNTAEGLQTMRTEMFTEANGDRPEVPDICVVLVDGVSNINSRRTIPEAEAARAKGIRIFAIGVGLTNTTELNGIASVPASDNAFNVQTFGGLQGVADAIIEKFC